MQGRWNTMFWAATSTASIMLVGMMLYLVFSPIVGVILFSAGFLAFHINILAASIHSLIDRLEMEQDGEVE